MTRTDRRTPPLFRALLKHYRTSRGMSQLDLAVAADVSGRHVSFLETGRAQPSREMVLRLAVTLGLGLRDQNELLIAAGMPAQYAESDLDGAFDAGVARVIDRMLEQQEPFPMLVMNRHHDVIKLNDAGGRLLLRFIQDPSALGERPNVMRVLFDPRLMRPFVLDWERLARYMLVSLQREALARPEDDELRALITEVLRYPGVPSDWHLPDLSTPIAPTVTFAIARDGVRLAFLTTLTVFNAPLDVSLQELRLESYFPADPETEQFCRALQ